MYAVAVAVTRLDIWSVIRPHVHTSDQQTSHLFSFCASFSSGGWYDAKVVEVKGAGLQFRIEWADGDPVLNELKHSTLCLLYAFLLMQFHSVWAMMSQF